MREFSRVSSNWRSQEVAEEYLERYQIPVLADIARARWCAICATTA